MKITSNERPKQIEKLEAKGIILINFDIEKTDEGFAYNQVGVSNSPTKGEIVNAIISSKYSIDAELAAINNYQIKEENYEKENSEYQEYRKQAKKSANIIINLINT